MRSVGSRQPLHSRTWVPRLCLQHLQTLSHICGVPGLPVWHPESCLSLTETLLVCIDLWSTRESLGMAFPRSLPSRSWAVPLTHTQTRTLTPNSPRTPGSDRVTWQPLWGSYSPRHGALQPGVSCARPFRSCSRQAGEKGSVRAKLGCTGRQGKARGALGKGTSRENSGGA